MTEINKKYVIIILLIILIALLSYIVYVSYTHENVEYQTIYLSNATTIEVPVSSESKFFNDNVGIKYYQDEKNGVQVISWNSQEELSIKGATDVVSQFEKQKGGATPIQENGVLIYFNDETGYYCIDTGNDTTHDNILIMAKDKDMALKMYQSIKYGVSSIDKLGNSQISTPSSFNSTLPNFESNQDNLSNDDDMVLEDDYSDPYYDDSSYVETSDSSSDSGSSSSSSDTTSDSGSASNVETTTDE